MQSEWSLVQRKKRRGDYNICVVWKHLVEHVDKRTWQIMLESPSAAAIIPTVIVVCIDTVNIALMMQGGKSTL